MSTRQMKHEEVLKLAHKMSYDVIVRHVWFSMLDNQEDRFIKLIHDFVYEQVGLKPDPEYAHIKDYPFIPDSETIHLIETELLRITRSVYDAAKKLIHFIKEEGKDLGIHDFPLEELQERRYPIHNDVITIVDQYTVVQNLEDYFKFEDWHEQLIDFNENGWLEDGGIIYDGVNYSTFSSYEINCHCEYETSANLVGGNAVMTTVEGYILLFVHYEDEVIFNAFGLKNLYRPNR